MWMNESILCELKGGRVVRFVERLLSEWVVMAMSRDINSIVGLIRLSRAFRLV